MNRQQHRPCHGFSNFPLDSLPRLVSIAPTPMARPRNVRWPVKIEELLRIILPNQRPEDRWTIFKAWQAWCFKNQFGRDPTDEEIERIIRGCRKRLFYPDNRTHDLMGNLRDDFLPIFRKENRIKKAQSAAKKRWSKENEGKGQKIC